MLETLLIIHILAAAAWIGGGLLNLFIGPKMAQSGGETALIWLGAVLEAVSKYFIPAGTLTLLSGIALVLVDDAYDWSAPFVWIGIVVVVLALGLVSTVMAPAAKRALAAARAGDFPKVGMNARTAAVTARVVVLLLILTEVVMVLRLGAS
ncbi:MAG: hypothetical protein WD269_03320 [Acidimicrobiia bacterium]